MGNVVEAAGVSKRYRRNGFENSVLEDVSLSIEAGQFVAIMGPSGSGKSTLLNILGAIDRDHSGSVAIDGTALNGCDDDALALLRRRSLGFVFQSFNLVPVLSAVENVALPGVIDGQHGAVTEQRAMGLLEQFGLADRSDQRPAELSGGEQQRVAIARALFLEPAVIVADEPTGNLDSAASASVMDVLADANRELGQTIVMVTHDPAVAVAADEALVLGDGTLRSPLGFSRDDSVVDRHRSLLAWLADAPRLMQQGRRTQPLVAK